MHDPTDTLRTQPSKNEQIALAGNGNDLVSSLTSPAAYRYDPVEEQGAALRHWWGMIRKRMWLIIGTTVLIPTLVAIYLVRKPDIYEAQARIQVDLENANPLLGGMSKNSSVILNSESNDPAYFNTQLQILTGPGLLQKVVTGLDLEHNHDFMTDHSANKSMWSNLRRLLGLEPKQGAKPSGPDVVPIASSGSSATRADLQEAERLSDYVEDLQKVLVVEPVKESRLSVRETRLIDISYRHNDPHLAAKIVNAVADTFVADNFQKRTASSASTGSYLQQRIAELQSTIRTKNEELINYGKNHQILSLEENQNTVVERLVGLNKQLLVAENERKFAEAAYHASQQPGAAEALAEGGGGAGDPAIPSATKLTTEAELKLADLRQRRAELLVENTEKWPAVKEIDKQIASREKEIADARSRATKVVTTNLGTRYRQAVSTEDSLRKAYEQQRGETMTQNEAAVQYRIIQQEIETNKSLLDGLLQRTRENDVVMTGTPNNIRVVDYAIAQKRPVAPKRTLIVLLSVVLAFGCGVALAFLLEYLDDSIRSTEDVERYLRLPSIAVIPQVGVAKPKRWLGQKSGEQPATPGRNGLVLLSEINKRSPIAEAYRHLRTSILLSTAGRPPRTLLITSSVPSEGKTTTAVNSAISLAQTGVRVLIVDADMRRPRLHSIFNVSNAKGLSSLLSSDVEQAEITSAIHHDEGSGLFILPAGPLPPNPAELLGSDQMLKLMSMLTPDFTHVVVDSPPVAAFTDGVLIASMVDGVLLVIHSGKNSRRVVARARRLLLEVGARIIGVVINKADASPHSDYYYNSYYSHYHYGPDVVEGPELTA